MQRLPGLDAARAFAVVAMVMGHTLDAVLSDAARLTPALAAYWQFRTFTAPLFLMVSGWAVITSVTQHNLSGWAVVKRYLPRVGLLFFWGFFLRLPIWDLGGLFRFDATLWHHFFAFDALHVIASSLFLGLLVLAWVRDVRKRLLSLMALGVLFPLIASRVWAPLSDPNAPFFLRQALGGGISPFPLFPWAGFFFVGAVVGLLIRLLPSVKRQVLFLVLFAGLAMALTGKTPVASMPLASPLLFSWRLGVPLLILAGALMLPSRWALAVAPVGRASLWVYVIHLPIAYGWAYWRGLDTRIGHSLEPLAALAVALSVTAGSIFMALTLRRLRKALRASKGRRREALSGLDGVQMQSTP